LPGLNFKIRAKEIILGPKLLKAGPACAPVARGQAPKGYFALNTAHCGAARCSTFTTHVPIGCSLISYERVGPRQTYFFEVTWASARQPLVVGIMHRNGSPCVKTRGKSSRPENDRQVQIRREYVGQIVPAGQRPGHIFHFFDYSKNSMAITMTYIGCMSVRLKRGATVWSCPYQTGQHSRIQPNRIMPCPQAWGHEGRQEGLSAPKWRVERG
jgi:hypothetical protein